jgi:PAS domain S-box-containing protein
VRRADGQYRWHASQRVPLHDQKGNIVRWYSVGVDIDDRKTADDALRRSESELADAKRDLQATIDSIPALVASYWPNGERDFVNLAWQHFTGTSQEDARGKTQMITVHPDGRARGESLWRRCLTTGEPFELEERLLRSDGEYRWHRVRRVPVCGANGEVVKWYGVGHDIDDQKRAEEALRQSEARLKETERELQLMIDTIPAFVTVFGPDGEREYVNKTWRDNTGLEVKDIQGGNWTRIVHPDDRERSDRLWREAIATGKPLEIQQRIRRHDGQYRWHMGRRVPLRDDSGNIVRWYSVAIDIEEQKRAQEAMRKSETELKEARHELQRTIDTIPVKVVTYEPDGTRSFVNQTWQSYTGFTLQDVTGQANEALYPHSHPDDVAHVKRAIRASLASGEPLHYDVRLRGADGEYRWHSFRGVPLRDENGAITRWYSTGFDIHDQKVAEAALLQSESRLAQTERELRLMLDSIPTITWRGSPTGSVQHINRRWHEYTGTTSEESQGSGWQSCVHPDDLAGLLQTGNQYVPTGQPADAEARLRRFDGTYRWFLFRPAPARDENGKVIAWYGIVTDIEDRKRTEEALRLSETRLLATEREARITLDSIPTIAWRGAPNGYVQSLNKRWFEYTGTTPEEMRGAGWKTCVHPDDLDRLVGTGIEYVSSENAIDGEARLRRFDGEYRWFLFRPAPARDEAGNIIGWYGSIIDIEDRKRAEEKAVAAERELQDMLDSIPAMIVRGGTNGYIQYFSKQWFEYTGTTLETARGFRWWQSLHPDDRDRLVEFGARFVATAEPGDCEARLRRSDGVYRWFLFRPAPARDEAGNFVGWYGTVTDIEDRKRAEEKAAEAEREVQRTIDNIPVLVGTYSAEGVRRSANKWALAVTGLTAEDLPDARWRKAFHPDDVEAVERQWRECVATGEPFEREVRTRMADGTYRWHSTRRVPLRDESGRVIRWYGTSYDIEDRKRAEQALAASERNLKLIIDTIPALAWSARTDGSAEFCNQHYLDYTGLSVEELQHWGFSKAVHPDDVVELGKTYRSILASGRSGEGEARLRRHDGEFRWFVFRANPLRDENGRPVKWYCIGYDIEDRKRAETLLAGEKQLLEMIASGRPLRDVLSALCSLVEEAAPDCHCAVHPIDWSGPKFEYGIAPSLPAGYIEPIAGLPVSAELLPYGIAANEKEQMIAEDIETDPRWLTSPVRAHALEYGLRAVWSTPISTRDGRILGTFCILRDKPARPSPEHQSLIAHATQIASIAIDRSRTETALRRNETMLAEGQRVSSTGSFSWSVDTDDTLTFSNELCRIFEFDPGAPVTFDMVFARIHPEDVPILSERMKLVRSGRETSEQEVRLRMPDDRIKYLRTVGQMVRHQDGRAEYLGAVQDVTQRRLAEQALDKVRSELGHVTRIMSLGALTASIAHEVNQPLAGIITNASTCLRMLAADPPNIDGARETARRTIRDGNRAADVIVRLRALFSKKTATAETVDLNEAAREVLALVFGDLLRNRVILRLEVGDDPLFVTGDRVQLQQVMLNLVRNASDAMSEVNDRPRHLLVRADTNEDDEARIVVKDVGTGFDPKTVERLFDAFYSTKGEGMGIGLSVSRSIVESHGGRLWAELNKGPGATFSFSIPRQDTSAEDEGASGANSTRPTRGARDVTRNAQW